MNIDIVTVRADVIIDVVLRYLRIRGSLPDLTDNLSVVDRHDNLIGTLSLTTLLTSDPQLFVKDVMASSGHALLAETPADEVAQYFEQHDLVSVPVVDETNHLLGRITIDDVVDVIRDEADQDLMRMAGLDEEDDIFAPIFHSASKRAIWLGINLLTALLASWVIGLFEDTIDKIVALAVLMPIVASMGGIAGSQTLTIVIRSIATGQLGHSNTRWLLLKEISVGLLNGLLWAVVVASIAYLWFDSESIGIIIAAALVINLVIATTAGVAIPLILKQIGIDPALAGTVLLTTVTDVIGFMAFLGLATLWLNLFCLSVSAAFDPAMLKYREYLANMLLLLKADVCRYNTGPLGEAVQNITPGIDNHAMPPCLFAAYMKPSLGGSDNIAKVFDSPRS